MNSGINYIQKMHSTTTGGSKSVHFQQVTWKTQKQGKTFTWDDNCANDCSSWQSVHLPSTKISKSTRHTITFTNLYRVCVWDFFGGMNKRNEKKGLFTIQVKPKLYTEHHFLSSFEFHKSRGHEWSQLTFAGDCTVPLTQCLASHSGRRVYGDIYSFCETSPVVNP